MESIEAREKLRQELLKASLPLMDFIRKNYTPETTVIVTGVYADVVTSEIVAAHPDKWD